jgi:hypothetical protein
MKTLSRLLALVALAPAFGTMRALATGEEAA